MIHNFHQACHLLNPTVQYAFLHDFLYNIKAPLANSSIMLLSMNDLGNLLQGKVEEKFLLMQAKYSFKEGSIGIQKTIGNST